MLAIASAALPEHDPEQVCATAALSGLTAVEWGAGPGQALPLDAPDAAVRRLVEATSGAGLLCCGLSVHDDVVLASPLGVWQRLVAAAASLGAPHLRVYACPPQGTFAEDFALLRERFAALARIAAAHDLRLLIEPAPGTLVPGVVLARDALSGLTPRHAGVVYDPGSLAREGWLDPFLAVDVLGEMLSHVHVKNTAPQRTPEGGWTWQRASLDSGIVHWARVFAALRQARYAGWIVLDHLSSREGDSLRRDLAHLRTHWGEESHGD
ncbi:sugar phosphate isomerase/epimerase family protein [Streptomyces sulfonofaciens]|uniref:sugar phosphate isomerase/epimerase family protein n=1 Tax=Streptomyces sulfonofaciens TaxID=68272 RepID=UPI0016755670|nr:sugar phosphate isomerase/epimerase family protein [Streptomyces sulfonofaciens]